MKRFLYSLASLALAAVVFLSVTKINEYEAYTTQLETDLETVYALERPAWCQGLVDGVYGVISQIYGKPLDHAKMAEDLSYCLRLVQSGRFDPPGLGPLPLRPTNPAEAGEEGTTSDEG